MTPTWMSICEAICVDKLTNFSPGTNGINILLALGKLINNFNTHLFYPSLRGGRLHGKEVYTKNVNFPLHFTIPTVV